MRATTPPEPGNRFIGFVRSYNIYIYIYYYIYCTAFVSPTAPCNHVGHNIQDSATHCSQSVERTMRRTRSSFSMKSSSFSSMRALLRSISFICFTNRQKASGGVGGGGFGGVGGGVSGLEIVSYQRGEAKNKVWHSGITEIHEAAFKKTRGSFGVCKIRWY